MLRMQVMFDFFYKKYRFQRIFDLAIRVVMAEPINFKKSNLIAESESILIMGEIVTCFGKKRPEKQ